MAQSEFRRIASITALLTLCLAIQAMMTRILGLSLVCMIEPQHQQQQQNSTSPTTETAVANISRGVATDNSHHFNSSPAGATISLSKLQHRKIRWDYKIQSNVVAAHDWGELLALPLAALIISNSNVRRVLVLSVLFSILATGLFPVVTDRFDSTGAFWTRLALGTSRAFSTPCIDASVSGLVPDRWRALMYSLVLSGNQLASILVNTLVAYYCNVDVLGLVGWQLSFFALCALAALWIVLWLRFGPARRHYQRGAHAATAENLDSGPKDKDNLALSPSVSARQKPKCTLAKAQSIGRLLKSPAVWCLFPCNVAAVWTTRLLTFYVPSFYRDVLAVPLTKNGIYSSLPFVALCIGKTAFSALATCLERYGCGGKNFLSKTFNAIGFVGSGVVLLLCGHGHVIVQRPSASLVIFYVTMTGAIFSATCTGFRASMVGVSRAHAAQVSAMCTAASMLGAVALPYVVGAQMTSNRGGTAAGEWAKIFGLVAVMNCAAAISFALFGAVKPNDGGEVGRRRRRNGQAGLGAGVEKCEDWDDDGEDDKQLLLGDEKMRDEEAMVGRCRTKAAPVRNGAMNGGVVR